MHPLRRRLPDRPEPRPRDEAHRQGSPRRTNTSERGQPRVKGASRSTSSPPGSADGALVRGEDGGLHFDHLGACDRHGRGRPARSHERHGPQAVGLLFSPRLTNEQNYLIQNFARTGAGRTRSTRASRPDTLRPFTAWSGLGQRSVEELDPGDRERGAPLVIGSFTTEASGAGAPHQEGRAQCATLVVADPRDLADEAREAPPPAPPGNGPVADHAMMTRSSRTGSRTRTTSGSSPRTSTRCARSSRYTPEEAER